MEKKKITKEEWAEFCKLNSNNSYCMVICLVIMHLWEKGVQNKEDAYKELGNYQYSLSGFQAEHAVEYALHYDAEEWLDKSMTGIVRGNVTTDEILAGVVSSETE